MFSLRDKVVYPGHGVALINRIVEQNVVGKKATFYELTFLNKDLTILVPTASAACVGIRHLSSEEEIQNVFSLLSEPTKKFRDYEFTASSWNRRNKQYRVKMAQGSIKAISEIYRDLKLIEAEKDLSFGEKNLLQQTEKLLAEEISLVRSTEPDRAVEEIRSLCAPRIKRRGGEEYIGL